jgi:Transglutaminase-like superfamily
VTHLPATRLRGVASRVRFRRRGGEGASRFSLAKHVAWTTIPGGGVVLDARRGVFYLLDDPATRALQFLVDSGGGLTTDLDTRAVPYSADREIHSLTLELLSKGILRREPLSNPAWARFGRVRLPGILAQNQRGVHPSQPGDGLVNWFFPTVSLVFVAASLRFLRLHQLASLVRRTKRRGRVADFAEVDEIARSVNESPARSLVRTACLERSLAIALAANLRGLDVNWCVGVRTPPFEAHAWVECDGRPVREVDEEIASMKRILTI